MENETPTPLPDGTYVETAFGRDDFRPVEDVLTRRFPNVNCAKNRNLDPAKVRAWARANGMTNHGKGRLRREVLDAYVAAHGGQ